jgi:hypothetical protein
VEAQAIVHDAVDLSSDEPETKCSMASTFPVLPSITVAKGGVQWCDGNFGVHTSRLSMT